MATRGTFGYRIGGVDKITYNHLESHPDGLGVVVVESLAKVIAADKIGEVRALATALRMVDHNDVPTAKDKAKCYGMGIVDLHVGDQSEDDWYCLLRDSQLSSADSIWPMLHVGIALKHEGHTEEYGYVIDLDAMMFVVIEGTQVKGALPLADIMTWKDTWIEDLFPLAS